MKNIYALSENFATEYINMREMMSVDDKKQAFILFASPDAKVVPEPIFLINGEIATIKISGPLSQSGPDYIDRYLGYGGTSYPQIIEAIESVKSNDSVKKIIIEIDTPGGEVSGCYETAEALYDLSKIKNTEAININCIASAGYWIASQARKIYGSSPLVETGSIGVVWVLRDASRDVTDKEYGYARVRIVSKNAKNKRPDITKSADRQWMQDMIDGIERTMIAAIARGRKVSAEKITAEYGQGAMFIASDPDPKYKDAVKIGMIDAVVDYPSSESVTQYEDEPVTDAHNPAPNAGINKMEVQTMTLSEFLSQNPAAKAEYDAIMKKCDDDAKAKFEAGKLEGENAVKARIDKAANFVGNAKYPGKVSELAVAVIKGEKSVDALETTVATLDALAEKSNSEAAAAESAAAAAASGQQPAPQPSKDGVLNTEADLEAEIAAKRKSLGMEVK